jgi:hypothetical protein
MNGASTSAIPRVACARPDREHQRRVRVGTKWYGGDHELHRNRFGPRIRRSQLACYRWKRLAAEQVRRWEAPRLSPLVHRAWCREWCRSLADWTTQDGSRRQERRANCLVIGTARESTGREGTTLGRLITRGRRFKSCPRHQRESQIRAGARAPALCVDGCLQRECCRNWCRSPRPRLYDSGSWATVPRC